MMNDLSVQQSSQPAGCMMPFFTSQFVTRTNQVLAGWNARVQERIPLLHLSLQSTIATHGGYRKVTVVQKALMKIYFRTEPAPY